MDSSVFKLWFLGKRQGLNWERICIQDFLKNFNTFIYAFMNDMYAVFTAYALEIKMD